MRELRGSQTVTEEELTTVNYFSDQMGRARLLWSIEKDQNHMGSLSPSGRSQASSKQGLCLSVSASLPTPT